MDGKLFSQSWWGGVVHRQNRVGLKRGIEWQGVPLNCGGRCKCMQRAGICA